MTANTASLICVMFISHFTLNVEKAFFRSAYITPVISTVRILASQR